MTVMQQPIVRGLMRGVSLGVLGLTLGCVIYVEDVETADACESLVCSSNAGCDSGQCFCNQGYSGNPYNDNGCQPTAPEADESVCDPGCGENAYCADMQCWCDEGHVAVCGDGTCLDEAFVCDGEADCPNGADEAADVCNRTIVQEFVLSDECDDGLDIDWRLWSEDNSFVWPGPDEVFRTGGLSVDTYEAVECYDGEWLYFGAQAGNNGWAWGVGLDGTEPCDACGYQCGSAALIDLGYLTCD